MLFPTMIVLPIAAITALLTGIVNTLAGGGSFAVIAALMVLGMDPATINGTMRVGILAQCAVAAITFARRGLLPWRQALWLLPAICLGAQAGALMGSAIPSAMLRPIFGGLLGAGALLVALHPGGFKPKQGQTPRQWTWLGHLLIASVGVYGGVLQAGTGFPLMAVLVVYGRKNPLQANAIKVAIMAVYTSVALPTYGLAGLLDWPIAGALALGSVLGGWIGANLQLSHGLPLIRWAFAGMLAISCAVMLLS